jgi:hypothetical protein
MIGIQPQDDDSASDSDNPELGLDDRQLEGWDDVESDDEGDEIEEGEEDMDDGDDDDDGM